MRGRTGAWAGSTVRVTRGACTDSSIVGLWRHGKPCRAEHRRDRQGDRSARDLGGGGPRRSGVCALSPFAPLGHTDAMSSARRGPLLGVVAALVAGTVVVRRLGYKVGGNVVVRCRQGHLFTTIWIPGASLKSIRLGWARLQHCPVGKHWTLVTPVKDATLTDEERRIAGQYRDVRIP